MSGARTKGPSVNHLVLTVRDIEASHRFYTEALGFEQCGELKGELAQSKMWFYRGSPEVHHDFALVEAKDPAGIAPPTPWQGFFPDHATGINQSPSVTPRARSGSSACAPSGPSASTS
jgi:catechol 2,3-dioxygenase-like lactoylglutathione lyase family enzyme